MGHTRLGQIPKSQRWQAVVSTFAGADAGADGSNFANEVGRIADAAMEAAARAITGSGPTGDIGEVFYLLTQVALAAKRPDPKSALRLLGIDISADPSPIAFAAEIHGALDRRFAQLGGRSDVAEIAQLSVGEALGRYLGQQEGDLFASSSEQLNQSLASLARQSSFGNVARDFFGTFVSRLLGFYLSRVVHPGDGQSLIGSLGDMTRFNEQLKLHGYQRSRIVHDFAEKWFSKTEFEKGIDRGNAKRFVGYALKKIRDDFTEGSS